jgi:hypothetical protein
MSGVDRHGPNVIATVNEVTVVVGHHSGALVVVAVVALPAPQNATA